MLRSRASVAHFATWASRLITCRFGHPQKSSNPGQGVSLWSSAHAAKSLAQSVFGFTVRRGWGAERERQAAPAVPKPPSPSHRALGCEPLVLALDDQHELDGRPQYDSIASRGVGGTKGRARARPSTARGKMGGNALFKRRTDR